MPTRRTADVGILSRFARQKGAESARKLCVLPNFSASASGAGSQAALEHDIDEPRAALRQRPTQQSDCLLDARRTLGADPERPGEADEVDGGVVEIHADIA